MNTQLATLEPGTVRVRGRRSAHSSARGSEVRIGRPDATKPGEPQNVYLDGVRIGVLTTSTLDLGTEGRRRKLWFVAGSADPRPYDNRAMAIDELLGDEAQ